MFSSVSVARNGNKVALVWVNPDGEDQKSARWAVLAGGKRGVRRDSYSGGGTARFAGDRLMGDGFAVVTLRDRPEGAVHLGDCRSLMKGSFEPFSNQHLSATNRWFARSCGHHGEHIRMLGLARQGPDSWW